jgi:hypothetical protein
VPSGIGPKLAGSALNTAVGVTACVVSVCADAVGEIVREFTKSRTKVKIIVKLTIIGLVKRLSVKKKSLVIFILL